MKAYRLSVKLKIGLIAFAVAIAVASLAYTNRLVDRLKDREQSIMRLWAGALEQLPKAQQRSVNPYQGEFAALDEFLARILRQPGSTPEGLTTADLEAYRRAVTWAQGMPPAGELGFIMDDILVPNAFDIPAIVSESETGYPLSWRNLDLDSTFHGLAGTDSLRLALALGREQVRMDETYSPIPIEITFPGITDLRLRQQVHYGESALIGELRIYPFLQLGFVTLFILVGYLGFSYVRKSEQSSLWVGMAKEAAHQLGTPISSLMGWIELLRPEYVAEEGRLQAVAEMDKDVERLRRVAGRFSDIGSLPKLEPVMVETVLSNTVEYMRRRTPQFGGRIELRSEVEPDLVAPLNAELFEWVIENLLKNAMDALEGNGGEIVAKASRAGQLVQIDISDTGKGIDRREWKNVFRPGYSTKKRGWGLGLSLAKRIVEDYHGGSLNLAQSRLGLGSTFRIEIPGDSTLRVSR